MPLILHLMLPFNAFICACPTAPLCSPCSYLALIHTSCACPAVHLGSPHLCSPALVHACPTVHTHWPSFVLRALVPPFVGLSCHLFGQPPFVLTGPHSCLSRLFVCAVP